MIKYNCLDELHTGRFVFIRMPSQTQSNDCDQSAPFNVDTRPAVRLGNGWQTLKGAFCMTYKKRDYTEMPIFIYALIDPETTQIRYIGKSIRPNERMTNHCNIHDGTHKAHWLEGLCKRGLKPIVKILEEMPAHSDWQARERFWIAEGKRQGWPLTNETSGGDGIVDLDPEARAKMLKTWTGRRHKPETLLKIGAASKGRTHTPAWKEFMHKVMSVRVFTDEHRERLSKGVRKLSDEQAQEILNKIAGGRSMRSLGFEYHVDPATIANLYHKKLRYTR